MTLCLSLLLTNYLAILALIAIAGGLSFVIAGIELRARKRLLLATRTTRIDGAPLGLVEIIGNAAGPHTMPAPVTGKPCFLYHTTVWQSTRRSDEDKRNWEKVADETLHLPFLIDDASKRLLIEPLGADLDLLPDFREEYDASLPSSRPENLPPRIAAFLFRHGIVPGRRLCIEERAIHPGDALFVTGTLMQNPGVELRPFSPRSEIAGNGAHRAGTSDSASENLLQPTSAQKVIRLSDDTQASMAREMSQQGKIAAALTRAGITKPEAWSAAGVPYQTAAAEPSAPRAAQSESRQCELSEAGGLVVAADVPANPVTSVEMHSCKSETNENQSEPCEILVAPPIVLMKGEKDSTFVISFRSQKEFAVGLGWKSVALMWGGSAIALLGAYTLLASVR